MTNTRAAISDIIDNCNLSNVEIIKVTARDDDTFVESHDTDKLIFIQGILPKVPDFTGVFGIGSIKLLSSLMKTPVFSEEKASLTVSSRTIQGETVIDELAFSNGRNRANYKLMNTTHIPKQATINRMSWDAKITGWTKDIAQQLQQMSGMYAPISNEFNIRIIGGEVIMGFGVEASSTHNAQMVFASVDPSVADIATPMAFRIDKFLMLLKLAQNAQSATLNISRNRVIGLTTETVFGRYDYYLRQQVKQKLV